MTFVHICICMRKRQERAVPDGVVFFAYADGTFRGGNVSYGESAARRSSQPVKSRISGQPSFAGGEYRDSSAPPAKPSLTGGAGPFTYASSGQASEQAGIS